MKDGPPSNALHTRLSVPLIPPFPYLGLTGAGQRRRLRKVMVSVRSLTRVNIIVFVGARYNTRKDTITRMRAFISPARCRGPQIMNIVHRPSDV